MKCKYRVMLDLAFGFLRFAKHIVCVRVCVFVSVFMSMFFLLHISLWKFFLFFGCLPSISALLLCCQISRNFSKYCWGKIQNILEFRLDFHMFFHMAKWRFFLSKIRMLF